MRMNAIVAGVGMSRFGKHVDTGLKALGAEVVQAALQDAGLAAADIEAAYVGNAMAGIITGQECIRGQVILRSVGIGRIPVINVENACGSGSTAFHQACAMVSAGGQRTETLTPRRVPGEFSRNSPSTPRSGAYAVSLICAIVALGSHSA